MKECFECGTTKDIQDHHVIPRLRGGTKTVPLCYSCHCRAHGKDSKGLEHSRLISEGIRKKFEEDPDARRQWGTARCREATILRMTEARVTRANIHTLKVGRVAYEMREQGETLQSIADAYMKAGTLTSRGGTKWSTNTIRKITARYQKLSRENK